MRNSIHVLYLTNHSFALKQLIADFDWYSTECILNLAINNVIRQLTARKYIITTINIKHLEYSSIHIEYWFAHLDIWNTVDCFNHQFDDVSSTGFSNEVRDLNVRNTYNVSQDTNR